MLINIPTNNSSMWGEISYDITTAESTDIVVTVNNDSDGTVAGVKKFYSSTSAKINVAPLLRHKMMPEAQTAPTGFWTPTTGFPKISITAADSEQTITTSTQSFNYTHKPIKQPSLITTMPTERLLAKGEFDTVVIALQNQNSIELHQTTITRQESKESTTITSITTDGAICYTVNNSDFADQFASLELDFIVQGESIGSVRYSLEEEPIYSNSYRVAWLSSQGSIEHYTFPSIVSQSHQQSGQRIKTLRSAYGSALEIEALSEVVSSPKVWRVTPTGYRRVEVSSTEFETRRDGTLSVAEITLTENG